MICSCRPREWQLHAMVHDFCIADPVHHPLVVIPRSSVPDTWSCRWDKIDANCKQTCICVLCRRCWLAGLLCLRLPSAIPQTSYRDGHAQDEC